MVSVEEDVFVLGVDVEVEMEVGIRSLPKGKESRGDNVLLRMEQWEFGIGEFEGRYELWVFFFFFFLQEKDLKFVIPPF